MYTDFDENIKPEYIILSDLKNYNLDYHDEYYYLSGMAYEREQKNPNKPKEENKLFIGNLPSMSWCNVETCKSVRIVSFSTFLRSIISNYVGSAIFYLKKDENSGNFPV